MSSDEAFILKLVQAATKVGLEFIVVGMTAGVLHGAPVMTQDIDILVRDTPTNRKKLHALCKKLGDARLMKLHALSDILTIVGADLPVDVIFDRLPGNLKFEAIRKRANLINLGKTRVRIASLEDIIASKKASGRPKDKAHILVLKDVIKISKTT